MGNYERIFPLEHAIKLSDWFHSVYRFVLAKFYGEKDTENKTQVENSTKYKDPDTAQLIKILNNGSLSATLVVEEDSKLWELHYIDGEKEEIEFD